jgi:PncC family amidohydrolase
VLEASTGGLLTLALAGRSGASRYFRQSRFAYDVHAKESLVGGALPGGSAVSEEAVAALAQAMRREARTDYALAESGMAGPPDGQRHSLKNGQCWLALAGPAITRSAHIALDPFLTRREHQLRFALHALALACQGLDDDAA